MGERLQRSVGRLSQRLLRAREDFGILRAYVSRDYTTSILHTSCHLYPCTADESIASRRIRCGEVVL